MLKHYAFDAFGPYALAFTAFTAGLDQATNTPPEWKQGFNGYAERFGSDFAIAAVGTTARYGTAAAFRDDTSYYRCGCKGAFPRLRHAVFSTLTARRGQHGHRVFSFPALVAPYVGSMVGVYGWYPSRYGVKDALSMGNYSLLESAGTNIGMDEVIGGHLYADTQGSAIACEASEGAQTKGLPTTDAPPLRSFLQSFPSDDPRTVVGETRRLVCWPTFPASSHHRHCPEKSAVAWQIPAGAKAVRGVVV